MRSELTFIFVLGAMLAPRAAKAVDYSVPGPETYMTTDFASGTAGSLGGHLVVPNGTGKYPLLVNTHGFAGNADQQIGWGQHYASYGFIAVVPSMPGGVPPDHKANGDIIRALVLLYSDPTTVSPAQGKVDAERIGLSGHSAGGLQTTYAAALLKPRATVLFDPVDYQMTGRPVYATICSPVMGIFAEPGTCNNQADWSTFKTTSIGPQVFLDVIGSNHCDPLNPATPGCDLLCGGTSSAQNQANYSRYSTAYFLALLKDDAAAAATLTQSVLGADTALRNTLVHDAPNCALGPSDGGTDASADVGVSDGPVPDSGSGDVTVADGGSRPDAAMDVSVADARMDAQADGAPPADVSNDAGADTSEPPAPDASTGADASTTPPKDSGGSTGTTNPSNPSSDSGCGCALAKAEHTTSRASIGALLLAGASIVRRSRARDRRKRRSA